MKYKVNRARFLRLIDFLNRLPQEKFDFNEIVEEVEDGCGTVCCAVGWFPRVFPGSSHYDAKAMRHEWLQADMPTTIEAVVQVSPCHRVEALYSHLSAEVLGISYQVGHGLFAPDSQSTVHPNLMDLDPDAAPRILAEVLEHFLKLVARGEIEDHELVDGDPWPCRPKYGPKLGLHDRPARVP